MGSSGVVPMVDRVGTVSVLGVLLVVVRGAFD